MTLDDDEAATVPYRSCPTETELDAIVAGRSGAGIGLAHHLQTCALCRAVIAQKQKTEPKHQGPTFAAGTMVGRYRIEDCLGAGGMGIVYRALDTELQRPVALKLVRAEGDRVEELTERLRRESRLQARAAHRGVITVYDIGRQGDQVYVAMELIRGDTLHVWLDKKPRPWRQVIDVFREAAGGLAAAHAAGLVHRDFKPDNVLVELVDTAVTRVLVTDFGIARPVEVGASVEQPTVPGGRRLSGVAIEATATGALLGTPAYMSPEQLHAASRVDARSDIFSFCVALWEAIYGERPFGGSTTVEIIAALMTPTVPEPPKGSAVPRWVCDVLRRGLVFEPDQRIGSIAALSAKLDWRTRRSQKRMAGVIAGLAVVTGVLAGALAMKPAADEAPEPAIATSACESPAPVAELVAVIGDAEPRTGLAAYTDGWAKLRMAACAAHAEPQVACLDASARELTALLAGAKPLPPTRRADVMRSLTPVVPVECTRAPGPVATSRALAPEVRLALAEAEGALVVDDARGAALIASARKVAGSDARALRAIDFVRETAAVAHGAKVHSIEQLADTAERDGDVLLASRARVLIAREHIEHYDSVRVGSLLAAADAAISRAGDPVVDRARWHLLQARAKTDDAAAALASVQRAERLLADARAPYDITLEIDRAVAYARLHKVEDTRRILDRALTIADAASDVESIQIRNTLAGGWLKTGSINEAEVLSLLEPLLKSEERVGKLRSPRLVLTITLIANAHSFANNGARALAVLETWKAAIDATIDPVSVEGADIHAARALVLEQVGRFADAERECRQQLEIDIATYGVSHRETAAARINHGRMLLDSGRPDDAYDELRRGIDDMRAIDRDDPFIPDGELTLAAIAIKRKQYDEAKTLADRAIATMTAHKSPDVGLGRLVLAQAIETTDPPRSFELVEAVLAELDADELRAQPGTEANALRDRLKKKLRKR